MNLNSINLYKLRNQAHFQFHSEVKAMIERETAEKLNVAEAFAGYVTLLEEEDRGLEQIKQTALTRKLTDSDAIRDETFSGLAANVKSLTKHFNPDVREKANAVASFLANYGNAATASYNEETAMLYNITNALLEQYADALTVCNLKEWVEALQQQNEDFKAIMAQRNEAITNEEPIHMRSLRKQIDDVYRLMEKRIEASALLNGNEPYADFIQQLNGRIEYYKTYNISKPKAKDKSEATDENK